MRSRTPSSRLLDIEDAAAPPPVGQLYSVRAQDLPGLESGTHYLVSLPGIDEDTGHFYAAILSADGTFVRQTRASKLLLCASRALRPDAVAESVRQGARDCLELPTTGWKRKPRRPEGYKPKPKRRQNKEDYLTAAEAAEVDRLVDCRPRGLSADEALRQAQAEGLALRRCRSAPNGFVGVYKGSVKDSVKGIVKFRLELRVVGVKRDISDRRVGAPRKGFRGFDTPEEAALVLARVLAAAKARREARQATAGPAADGSEGMVYVEAESADDSDDDDDECLMVSAVEIGDA